MVFRVSIFNRNDILDEIKDGIKKDKLPLVNFIFEGKKDGLMNKINQELEVINKNIDGEKIPLLKPYQIDLICCKTAKTSAIDLIKKYIVITKESLIKKSNMPSLEEGSSSDEESNYRITELEEKINRLEKTIEELQEDKIKKISSNLEMIINVLMNKGFLKVAVLD